MADEHQAQNLEAPIVDVAQLNQEPQVQEAAEQKAKEEAEQSKDQDKEGGVGTNYSVPISSYAAFKSAVLDKGFDIDNYYGWQCWDGTALLWQQLGRSLWSGNGLAIGCWDLKREVNKYDQFDLVTDVNHLKLGDVVAMRPNHIGFFDGYDGNYMRILGQNQGGALGPQGGMAFNVVRISKSAFAGAFRYRKWNVVVPRRSNEIIAREVRAGAWGNGDDRKNRLTAAGYNYAAIQAIVNKITSKPNQTVKLSNETVAQQVINGAWGSGNDRKKRLEVAGYNYNAIQAIVNTKMGVNIVGRKSNDQVANEVIVGRWGKGQERKNRLTAAGYNYSAVQEIVNRRLGF